MAAAGKYSKGRMKDQRNSDHIRLSKSLSWLLRHGVNSVGLTLQPGGFLYLTDVLKLPQFSRYTIEDVQQVVDSNDKKRFALAADPDNGQWKIRANQGHTIEIDDLELTPITDSAEVPIVVHGTNMAAWKSIQTQGLRRMRRVHIHFAVGEPEADGVISGMRKSSDVMIYLDVDKALGAGIKLFRSANNVILSPGMEDGVIPPTFFCKVVNRKTGKELAIESQVSSIPSEEDGAGAGGASVVTADDLADEMERTSTCSKKKKKHKHKQKPAE